VCRTIYLGVSVVGRTERSATTGDVVGLPKDVPHIHPWNDGNEVLHWRIIIQLATPDMQLLLAPAGFFESTYALAQRGRGGKDGAPKNLLQTIMLLQALEPTAYIAELPIWIQRPLFGLLAATGRVLGYKSYYPAASTSVESDRVAQ
jgi:hypothetical protein